jgi:hypothetical protein
VAKVVDVWPEGNDSAVPSGRVRSAAYLMPIVSDWVRIWARTRSAPSDAVRGLPDTRPIA